MPQIPAARPFFILAIDLCISVSDGGSHEIVADGVALVAASISSLDIGAGCRFNRHAVVGPPKFGFLFAVAYQGSAGIQQWA